MPEFSIVIPVYKAAHTIERCVESIERNSFKDIEIILIEDGSPDNSAEVCDKLKNKYSNLVVLHNEKNCGVSYTRNRGLSQAKGKYTMFVDSDDWVDESYYAEFHRIVEKCQPQFAVCGFVNHDERQNGRTDIYAWDTKESVFETECQSELTNLYQRTLLQQLWNKLFLTEVLQRNQIKFDESISIGEDFRFILSYLECAQPEKIIVINKALYHYMRDQEGSLMFRIGYESVEEPLKNLRRLYQLYGMNEEVIEERVSSERERHIELYAYLIMHNMGMSLREKRKLIRKLETQYHKTLFWRCALQTLKEQLYQAMIKAEEK